MRTVTYGIAVTARRVSDGWELTLNNGGTLLAPDLDDAVTRVRAHLDAARPDIDHRTVSVILTVEADISPAPEHTPDPTPAREAPSRDTSSWETGRSTDPFPDTTPAPDAAPRTPAPTAAPRTPEPVVRDDPDGMSLTLRFLAARGQATDFADAASKVVPWVGDLPAAERQQCLADLWVALNDATGNFNYGPLEDAVARWRRGADSTGTSGVSAGYTAGGGDHFTDTSVPAASSRSYSAPDPAPVDLLSRVSLPPEPSPEPTWTPDSSRFRAVADPPVTPGQGSYLPDPPTPDPTPSSPGFLTGFPAPSHTPSGAGHVTGSVHAPPEPVPVEIRDPRPARPARREGGGRHRL